MKIKNQIKPLHNLPPIQYQILPSIISRDSIPNSVRHLGMICYVISENTTYRLVGGLTNSDWEEVKTGGGGYTTTFVDSDLTSGYIVFEHNLNAENSVCNVTIRNNINRHIIPDDIIEVDSNHIRVDLSMMQPLIGEWAVIINCVEYDDIVVNKERLINSFIINDNNLG